MPIYMNKCVKHKTINFNYTSAYMLNSKIKIG